MRVLLISPQTGLSFWTLPKALRLTGKKAFNPPLGLITVAALLPPEWPLQLVDLRVRNVTDDDWYWADMVMISGNLGHRPSMLELVGEAKKRGKPVTVGGVYPTALPEELLDAGVDFVVRGEGENTVPLLLEAFKGGKTGGIIENGEYPDLATSPVPRYDLLNRDHYHYALLQTSRGCPFKCEFCDIISIYGPKPRHKSPDQVIAELDSLYRLGWRGTIFVADDNFVGSKKHARAKLEKVTAWQKRMGEPFAFCTQASVDLGQDLELIDLMTAANFGDITVGVESPSEEVLAQTRKYQNIRNPLMESLANINKNGLPVLATFIMGFDGEKKGIGDRICAFVEEANLPVAMISTLWAFPRTALWDRLKSEGRLIETKHTGDDFIGGDFNFVPSRPESEIVEELVGVWDYLYEPSRFLGRAYRHFLAMRPTRRAIAINQGQSPPDTGKSAKTPLRESLRRMRAFAMLVWHHGIRSSHRRQFWNQFFGILRENPSRANQYFIILGYGLDLFTIREMLLKRYRSDG